MNTHAHNLTRAQVVALMEERDTLREALRQMQQAMAPQVPVPRNWRLTPKEIMLLLALRRASPGILTKEQCIIALYGVIDDAIPDQKIIDVFICKIRRKLMEAQARIEVTTVWGRGYQLDAMNRQRLNAALQELDTRTGWTPGQPFMIAAE